MTLMTSENASRLQDAHSLADVLTYTIGGCALGRVLIARSKKGVCAILLGDTDAEVESDLAARFPQATHVASEALLHDDLVKVRRFAENPADGLHLTLDMRGTPIQRRIWEKLRVVPVGRTVSYMELGRWMNPPANARVVAAACAANPIALAIPCHRVIRCDGSLADYRWGIDRKRNMLRREARQLVALVRL